MKYPRDKYDFTAQTPDGIEFIDTYCAKEVGKTERQCKRAPGQGHNGLFCGAHKDTPVTAADEVKAPEETLTESAAKSAPKEPAPEPKVEEPVAEPAVEEAPVAQETASEPEAKVEAVEPKVEAPQDTADNNEGTSPVKIVVVFIAIAAIWALFFAD